MLPLVLIEARSDHREILVDELEAAALGRPLLAPHSFKGLPEAAHVIVASMASDAARVLPWVEAQMNASPPPGLVLITSPEDKWAEEAEERWPSAPRLDKRKGLAFLHELVNVVEATLRGPSHDPPADTPDDPELEALSRPSFAADDKGEAIASEMAGSQEGAQPAGEVLEDAELAANEGGAPVASLAFQERVRRELLLAGILAGEVETLLGRLEALAGLFRHRVPGDPAIERYAACLSDEVQRGRALSARIASLGVDEHGAGARLMSPADLVKLRVAAWRRWLPTAATIQIHMDARAPRVAVWPEVLGPLLDEIVGVVVRADMSAPSLSLRVDPVFRESVPGSPRWVRLELAGAHAHAEGKLPREDLEVLLERARTVMAAHGGSVEHSGLEHPGPGQRGTSPRIALLLPAASAEPFDASSLPLMAVEGAEAPEAPPAGIARSEARAARVLVVDDDESIRDIASEMLEVVGHHPRSVSSGEAAVELYESGERFDLVLLDMQMGGMDGRRTFNALRRLDPQLRAILVSGSATGTEIRTLLSEGLLGFLAKPFSVVKLKEVVESALRDA